MSRCADFRIQFLICDWHVMKTNKGELERSTNIVLCIKETMTIYQYFYCHYFCHNYCGFKRNHIFMKFSTLYVYCFQFFACMIAWSAMCDCRWLLIECYQFRRYKYVLSTASLYVCFGIKTYLPFSMLACSSVSLGTSLRALAPFDWSCFEGSSRKLYCGCFPTAWPMIPQSIDVGLSGLKVLRQAECFQFFCGSVHLQLIIWLLFISTTSPQGKHQHHQLQLTLPGILQSAQHCSPK